MLPTYGIKMGKGFLCPFDKQFYLSNGKETRGLQCGTQQYCGYRGEPCKEPPGGHHDHKDVTPKAFLLFVLRFALRLIACYLGPLFDQYAVVSYDRLWKLYFPKLPIDHSYLSKWKGTLKKAKERRELFCRKSIWVTLGIDPKLNKPVYSDWIFKKVDAIVFSVYHHTRHFGLIHYQYPEMCGSVPNPLVPYPEEGERKNFLY